LSYEVIQRMKTVSIRLPEELLEEARLRAMIQGTTLSQKARWLIQQWVEAEEAADDELLCRLLDGQLRGQE